MERTLFPGLRFAPPGAIFISSLRERAHAFSGSFNWIESTCGGAKRSLIARKGFLAWVHADWLRFVVSQVPKAGPGAPGILRKTKADLIQTGCAAGDRIPGLNGETGGTRPKSFYATNFLYRKGKIYEYAMNMDTALSQNNVHVGQLIHFGASNFESGWVFSLSFFKK